MTRMTHVPMTWISKLRIENYKSIEYADLDLGPLTVLVGANSAGKSSVLQTLVLLSQIVRGRSQSSVVNLNGAELQLGTFADIKHSANKKSTISLSVVLNADEFGPAARHMRRGRRQNISMRETLRWGLVLGRPDSKQIGSAKVTKLELETERPAGLMRAVFTPTRDRERLEAAASRDERLDQYRVRGELAYRTTSVDPSKVYDARLSGHFQVRDRPYGRVVVASKSPASLTYFSNVENGLPDGIFEFTPDSVELARAWLNCVEAPLRISGKLDTTEWSEEATSPDEEGDSAPEPPGEMIALLFPSFRTWVEAFDHGDSPEALLPPNDLDRFTELLSEFPLKTDTVEEKLPQALAKRLEQERPPRDTLTWGPRTRLIGMAGLLHERMSTALWYLGPLREDPSPAYRPGQGVGIARLGLKGEYTVPELERFGSTEIEALLPPNPGEPFSLRVSNDELVHSDLDRPPVKTSLKDAVDRWMNYLGVASAVRVRETGRAGIELGIVDNQIPTERNLTNVGVGVSQLLPVVVTCLRAQRGDVVLIEQPELHLHPAPQQALGDFLLAMSMSGRQLIIETHSEYLINRLRLRIAEDDSDSDAISGLVKIIYAERRNGKTQFRPIKPNAYGSFDDWPEDFFDQAPKETEKILRAAMKKRKLQRSRSEDRDRSVD
ncbi:AAA family ATPase [Mycobacterium sp. RTGN5]|uniref:AAA family ATPase n=1 Tax=Mycobacterium sp. RTGN5 TaxID=3016522 RepID=UPI0029C81067|nr:DUF3696 domain-containing protein [Mycobacterium sp. RTGN5]